MYRSSKTTTVSSANKATNLPEINYSRSNDVKLYRCQQSKPDPPECKVVLQQRATSLLGNVVIYSMQV